MAKPLKGNANLFLTRRRMALRGMIGPSAFDTSAFLGQRLSSRSNRDEEMSIWIHERL